MALSTLEKALLGVTLLSGIVGLGGTVMNRYYESRIPSTPVVVRAIEIDRRLGVIDPTSTEYNTLNYEYTRLISNPEVKDAVTQARSASNAIGIGFPALLMSGFLYPMYIAIRPERMKR